MKRSQLLVLGLTLSAMLAAGCGTTPTHAGFAPSHQGVYSSLARPTSVRALDAYYAPAAGKKGAELLQALNHVVAPHKDLGYNQARDVMFGEADDIDNNNVVECDYTDRVLENVTNRGTAYRGGKGFNAEHTWPQSKGAVGAAKADMHHLFPTDCQANSVRGSFPFGEVVSTEWSEGGSQRGTNDRGQTVFEPKDEQKGNTARAILYFYTVYGQKGSTDLQNFQIEEEVLKRWHEEDPVTAEDRARNEVVFKTQGNRNPFVDHPEFVRAIGQFLGARSNSRFNGPRITI